MRCIADVPRAPLAPHAAVVRAMLHDDGAQVHLFLYDRREDAPCCAHQRHATVAAAQAWCEARLSIAPSAWRPIADPGAGDRDDLIAPRRAAADGCGG